MADRTFTLLRHGQSTYNERGLLNGDPEVAVRLTNVGRAQCISARNQLAGQPIDLAVHTRFGRTAESLAIIIEGRDVRVETYPELDDVRLGVFESAPVDDYRVWRDEHTHADAPPDGGESRLAVLARYADGFERMLGEDARHVLAVVHDIPVRFLQNAVNGDDPLDGPITTVPNATPVVFSESDLRRGIGVMRERLAAG